MSQDREDRGQPAAVSPAPLERVGSVDGTVLADRSAFDSAGRRFVTKTDDDVVRVWDARTREPITTPLRHRGLDELYCISGDGNTVLTAARGEVRLWDVETSEVRSVTRPGELLFADVSPDGKSFVCVTGDAPAVALLWRAGEPGPAKWLDHGRGAVVSAQFNAPGTRLVTQVLLGPYRVWSVARGARIREIDSDDSYQIPYRAQFDPSGDRVVVPFREGFEIVDCRSGGKRVSVKLPAPLETARVRFSPDGTMVAVVADGWHDRRMQIYSADTGRLVAEAGRGIASCDLISGGRWAVCGNYSDLPEPPGELWDVDTKTVVQFVHEYSPKANADGSVVLFTDPTGRRTSVWRVRSGQSAPPQNQSPKGK